MIIKFSDELITGNNSIDAQHKELFSRINRLFDENFHGNDKIKISGLIVNLEEYIATHFYEEENLQLVSQYPFYNIHKSLHDDFESQFARLKDQYYSYGASEYFIQAVKQRFNNWWHSHICNFDMDVVKHLKKRSELIGVASLAGENRR